MDTPGRLNSELVDRFSTDLKKLWPGDRRLGLAVSGGPDSLALLLLAHAALSRIEVATVDHGLRPESGAEAQRVAAACAALGVPHTILNIAVAQGNLQSKAREARYAAIAEWLRERGLAALATAHHADDQAETLLMRLNRASGVAGLAGVRARTNVLGTDLFLLRPLLGWRRSELEEIVAASGLIPVQDPSNCNPRFDRARIRASLAGSDWIDVQALASSAQNLAEADAALDWAARREWAERVARQGLGVTYRPSAPRAIALRVLDRIVREMDGEQARGAALARVFDALVEGQPASIGQLVARPTVDGWSFVKAPARRR